MTGDGFAVGVAFLEANVSAERDNYGLFSKEKFCRVMWLQGKSCNTGFERKAEFARHYLHRVVLGNRQ